MYDFLSACMQQCFVTTLGKQVSAQHDGKGSSSQQATNTYQIDLQSLYTVLT
jgi:hypothetical protein